MKNILGKKAYVGMSGGVDSSVTVALLQEQGYDVTGVFIKVWQPDFMPCSWKDERRDAMRVAAHLNIPFVTLDLEKEYKKEVVDYMIDEYKKGRTPNPDVMCNRYVKFGGFFDWAMSQGADVVATGHYARTHTCKISHTPHNGHHCEHNHNGAHCEKCEAKLLMGRDSNKDQSYFLWTLTPDKLAKTLFPVGDIEKPEVRALAKKFKLPNAEKKDSQGLCFVGKVDMKEFLKHFINEKPGDVLNVAGEVIGHHEGSLFYTNGERHGFTITKKTPDDRPYFVISKNHDDNTLTVSNEKYEHTDETNESSKKVTIINTNWISPLDPSKTYQAKVRYRGILHSILIISRPDNEATITFISSSDILAPGQSIVVYDGEECVGGGIIK